MSVSCSGEEVEFEDGSLQMSSVLLIKTTIWFKWNRFNSNYIM